MRRLLKSIAEQTCKPIEVIVTDDSPDDSVMKLCRANNVLPIRYFKNEQALGTPANWNYGISLAQGEWIKLMHDDDWFRSPESLRRFAEKTAEGKRFLVSRYANVFENGTEEFPAFPQAWRKRIVSSPLTLIAWNVIGPPSVTMVHRSIKEEYDTRMKWRVDTDYYTRLLQQEKTFVLIDEPLINVGIGSTQVTNDCINLPHVELPEGLLLLQKYGVRPLQNMLVYDAWWRMLRNTGTRSQAQLTLYTPGNQWPAVIAEMVSHQTTLPASLLRNGFVSKPAMFLSYVLNQKNLRGE